MYEAGFGAPRHGGGGHGGGHGGHGGHGGGGFHVRPTHPIVRGIGPGWWWDVPWSPEVITTTETCRTWSNPIAIPPAMETAARSALAISRGQPTTVRGPDNVLYLFSIENGVLTARSCAAVATLGDQIGVGNIFKDFGHAVSSAAKGIAKGVSTVVHTAEKVPVLGNIVHIADEATMAPVHIVSNIAKGARIDHVVLDAFKDQLKVAKDVAPYAKTVVSFVPGIGTGVAAAIGAGAALAEGKSIDEAAKEAIRSAIPGGALGTTGFDLAMKVASGESVTKAALEAARAQLPEGAQQAFDIGLAVATGEKLQNVLAKGLMDIAPEGLQSVLSAGQQALASTPGLAAALKTVVPGGAEEGFRLAAGLLSHAGINEKALTAVRRQLPLDVQQGFDTALKTQEHRISWLKNVTSAPPSAPLPPKAPPKVPEPPKKVAAKPAPKVPEPPKVARKPAAPKVPEPPKKGAPTAPAVTVAQRGAYAPYPQHMGVSGTLGGCGDTRCRTLGAPVTDMPKAMEWAGRSAVHGSRGRPRLVQAPDGTSYLFAIENGVLTARPCLAFA